MSRYFPLWSLALLGMTLIIGRDRTVLEWLVVGCVMVFLTSLVVGELMPAHLVQPRKWIERCLGLITWALLIGFVTQLIPPLLQFVRDPDWPGLAAPAAILIPVATIFVVTGGWASFRDKYIKSTKEN